MILNLRYKKIEYFKDLLFELTKKELKIRYRNSYLGYIWSILNPLALALVFFFVFRIIMRVEIENYALFLISGLFPWQFFTNSVNASTITFINNASLIKKTTFPREMLIYSLILSESIHFLLTIPVIIFFMFIYGKVPSVWWVVGLPLLMASQFLLVAGISLAVASINLFFRDLERLVSIFTNLLFYSTPIIYSFDLIPKVYHTIIICNPLTLLILTYRDLFLKGIFNIKYFLLSFLFSAIIFCFGYLVYRKLKWKFTEAL